MSQVLIALQYADSFFPSGSVSFSWGLETLASTGDVAGAKDLRHFIVGQIRGRWATFDRAFVIAAHAKSRDLDYLVALDNTVELKTWPSEMRIASRRTGEALLGIHKRLGTAGASDYHFRVRSQQAFGHAPIVQGFLWAKAGLDVQTVVAMSAHMLCVSLMGAAIRLGIVTHIEAQLLFGDAHKEIDNICAKPAPDPQCASAFTPQSEIAVMKHEYQETRLFAN